MFDLVKICHHKQFLCIHDDIDNLIESARDSKLLSINSINSQHLDKKEQEVKNEEIDIVTEIDDVLPSSDENDDDYNLLLGEADLFLSDNSIPPGIENVVDDPEGDIRFLEELLIDDSILSH
nr:hypothetical protein [Tanacetum cinerariifolium]